MLSKDCGQCSYCIWMVGIGQGIRCNHPENELDKEGIHRKPIISYIKDCKYKNTNKFKKAKDTN